MNTQKAEEWEEEAPPPPAGYRLLEIGERAEPGDLGWVSARWGWRQFYAGGEVIRKGRIARREN